jgi:hypothetical protein
MKTRFLLIATFVFGTTLAASAQDDTKTKVKTTEDGVTKTEVTKTDHDKMLGRESTKTTTRTTTQEDPKAVQKVEKGADKTGHAVKSGAKKTGHAVKKGAQKTGSAVKKGAHEVVEHTPGTDANKERKAEKAAEKSESVE